jgi:hypothetical protein
VQKSLESRKRVVDAGLPIRPGPPRSPRSFCKRFHLLGKTTAAERTDQARALRCFSFASVLLFIKTI